MQHLSNAIGSSASSRSLQDLFNFIHPSSANSWSLDDNPSSVPTCRRCRQRLGPVDKQKSSGRYWKACKRCRDREAESKRRGGKRARVSTNSTGTNNVAQKRHAPGPLSRDTKHCLRDCSVCAESVSSKDLPSLKGCEHPPDVCRQCFSLWLEQQMASTMWEQVKCPSSGCNKFVTHEDVRTYASPAIFEK
jgi:hypothetical protein